VTVEEQSDADQLNATATGLSVEDQPSAAPVKNSDGALKWARSLNSAALVALMIGIAIFVAGLGIHHALKKHAYAITQITSNSEDSSLITAMVSPGGNIIASTDGVRLFVTDAKAIEWHALTVPGAAGSLPTDIEWFPDGIHLLICTVDPGTGEQSIWSISVLSDQATLILKDGAIAAPSPDGRHIAFMRNERRQLWIADATGDNARLLYSDTHPGEMAGPAYFSADGRHVLLLHADSHHSTITAHSIVTRQSHTVFESDTQLGGFIPLQDDEILYVQYVNAVPQGDQLLVSNINLATGAYTRPALVETFPTNAISSFSATRRREKILVTRTSVHSDIYIAALSNDGAAIEQPQRLTRSNKNELPTEWIDNETILMTSDRDGALNVFSQKLGSDSVTQLTTGRRDLLRPTMSADRNWLFYVTVEGQDAQQHATLYRRSMRDGTEQTMYSSSDPKLLMHCAYHADRCVIAEHSQNEYVFYDFDPSQGRGRQLARLVWQMGPSVHRWDLSRDGKLLALLDSENHVDTITVLDLEHSPVLYRTVKAHFPGPPCTLTWNADSSGFYVSTCTVEGAQFNLLHVGLDGTSTVLRSETLSQDGWAIPSPDGKHLAYQRYESVGNIWSLER